MATMKDLDKIEVGYDRNKGFKNIDELQPCLTQEAFDMVKAHTTAMEKDARLREVTHKAIIRVVLIISLIVLIILLVLANSLSALICFTILVALCYFLAIMQAKKLKTLKNEYALKIAGSDWDYFGCKIENQFGLRSWKFYGWVPFISPSISIIVHIIRRPDLTKLSARDIDNGLIVGKVRGCSLKPAIAPAIPTQQLEEPQKKKFTIPLRGRLNPLPPLKLGGDKKYKEDHQSSIDLGHHEQSQDQDKKMENEKLFG